MEEPSTLAESLLDDLDDLSDNDEGEVEEPLELLHSNNNDNSSSDNPQLLDTAFLDESFLNKHLKAIRDTDMSKPNGSKSAKEVEQEEYQLIVQSNKQLARLGDELARAHGQLCVAYSGKFPELEEIIPNPVQYKNAVKVIRNEMDISLVNDALNEFMTANQVLTVSVSGSTTSGGPLNEDQLVKVDKAVQYMEDLISLQDELASFVERRMERMAPNVSVIVGTKIAAQLLGLAGGLEELSKIPSCNLQVIGQTRHTSASRAGLGSINARPHEGILRECAFVQRCSKNLHTKALKTVAAKVSLAARCDFANVSAGRERNSSAGESFCREIEAKIQKWLEPDKAPMLKALPKPDLTIKKRRGGKRIRRIKERFEETAMMKQANTRAFGAQAGEYGDDVMGLTRGLLDTQDISAGGALRKTTEKRKMRFANTKVSRKKMAQMSAKAPTNGLSTSIAFTPVQGMELVNPDANRERVNLANKKWFNDNAGFMSALPKK